jgi:hypothetical protein
MDNRVGIGEVSKAPDAETVIAQRMNRAEYGLIGALEQRCATSAS